MHLAGPPCPVYCQLFDSVPETRRVEIREIEVRFEKVEVPNRWSPPLLRLHTHSSHKLPHDAFRKPFVTHPRSMTDP